MLLEPIHFSVVIPTYNRLEFLISAIESVERQTYKSFEIIVVDDGSTDDTLAHLSALGDRVTLLRQMRKGPGAARNMGARHASGAYVAFLDSDDLWLPWSLA